MNKRVVVDPSPASRDTCASKPRPRPTAASPAPGARAPWCAASSWILEGRDPREAWAFAQRICGVCTLVHGMASIRVGGGCAAVARAGQRPADPQPDGGGAARARPRDALLPPARARLGRRRLGAEGRPEGDPRRWRSRSRAGPSPAPATSPTRRKAAPVRRAGQLGIFAGGFWGHPAYKLPPEANLMAVAHYPRRWPGNAMSPGCTPSSAARTRTPTSWSAARPARSAPGPGSGGAAATTLNVVTLASCARSSSPCRPSSTRSTCPTRWPSPASTRTGSRAARAGQLHRGRLSGAGRRRCGDGADPRRRDPRPRPEGHPAARSGATRPRCRSSAHPGTNTAAARRRACIRTSARPKLAYSGPKPPYEQLDVGRSYPY